MYSTSAVRHISRTVMFSCLAIFANGNTYISLLPDGYYPFLSFVYYIVDDGGEERQQGYINDASYCPNLSSIRVMADELYVQFKLSDRSVQIILGVMLKSYPDSYLTKLVFNHSFKSTADDQGFFWVDEEPQIFAAILTLYRHGQLILPDIFVAIRDSIINKYLLPVEISSCVHHPPRSITTTYTTYVRLHGLTRSFTFPPSTELKTRRCTLVDPLWSDLPESHNSGFSVSVLNNEGNQYVLKSCLTVMNWLLANGYEIERWNEMEEEADLKKVHTRTTS